MTQDPTVIAVRAYAPTSGAPPQDRQRWRCVPPLPPSSRTLVFDTETTTDAAQAFRFGMYQCYEGDRQVEAGVFYEPGRLTRAEERLLRDVAAGAGWRIRTRDTWMEEVFLREVWQLGGRCVGFNMPFDLSRIALDAVPARGRQMHGGFSLRMGDDKRWPRVQVKALHQEAARIRFTRTRRQLSPGSQRKRGWRVPQPRGVFIDVHTLGRALMGGRSWSLEALSHELGVAHPKNPSTEHGTALTVRYLTYAMGDVQATWECFRALQDRYAQWHLDTPLHALYSEASLGKALLKQMGVRPWRDLQLDMPPDPLGTILSTYYGGRSEVHPRRTLIEVRYADFTSMYPTVCTLMGLWRFVTAQGVEWADATEAVRTFLHETRADDWQHAATWQTLPVLVQIHPDDTLLPVRAPYTDRAEYTIGLNYLTTDQPLWYTLADCVAATILGGKPPQVLRAIRFTPRPPQEGLKVVSVPGDGGQGVDPYRDDLYRRLVDLRQTVKAAGDKTAAQALKILVNSTSYGIFVELNVVPTASGRVETLEAHGPAGTPFRSAQRQEEEPGRYFHPLLATLITGAARLMLAPAEHQVVSTGLTWAFCDTDSLAIARPDGMPRAQFRRKAKAVTAWFHALNPYATPLDLFKWEDANFALGDAQRPAPLFCWAVSAKRYALFNRGPKGGRPVIRKATAHGLGHLLPPYPDGSPSPVPESPIPLSDVGVRQWQHDVWMRIIEAACAGRPDTVRLDDLPGFQQPAMSRYAVTTAEIHRWFKAHNTHKPYAAQVKPFNFLSAFSVRAGGPVGPDGTAHDPNATDVPTATRLTHRLRPVHPIAPFDRRPEVAMRHAFDRVTGTAVRPRQCQTYAERLAQYHLHPEAKFHHGDYLDRGFTARRHIVAERVVLIGKEANRWEEQYYLGQTAEAQIVYGISQDDAEQARRSVIGACREHTVPQLARASGLDRTTVQRVLDGTTRHPKPETLAALARAAEVTHGQKAADATLQARLRAQLEAWCECDGPTAVAATLGVKSSVLGKMLVGRRRITLKATKIMGRHGWHQ